MLFQWRCELSCHRWALQNRSLGPSTATFHAVGDALDHLYMAAINGPSLPQLDPPSTAIYLILMASVVEGLSEALHLRAKSPVVTYFIHLYYYN